MSVYADVIAWSGNLPLWQRDALRRLATQASLTGVDIDALTAACLAEANQQVANPTPIPIDNHHVPSSPGNGSPVAIAGISACKCLNAISDGQGLTFGPAGLTIVYGDNGTGKSGFARVLRNACHARGAVVDVLPDVYAEQPGRPEACVHYHVNGSTQTFNWSQGGAASPEEFRAVAHRGGQTDEYKAQLTNTFGLLREGWERAVEELLLNQTVMRFDHRVQTQRLKNLHDITQEDLDEIDTGMTVCSKWLPEHAQAPAINETLPEPGVLLEEIQRLERFTQGMRQRGRS